MQKEKSGKKGKREETKVEEVKMEKNTNGSLKRGGREEEKRDMGSGEEDGRKLVGTNTLSYLPYSLVTLYTRQLKSPLS